MFSHMMKNGKGGKKKSLTSNDFKASGLHPEINLLDTISLQKIYKKLNTNPNHECITDIELDELKTLLSGINKYQINDDDFIMWYKNKLPKTFVNLQALIRSEKPEIESDKVDIFVTHLAKESKSDNEMIKAKTLFACNKLYEELEGSRINETDGTILKDGIVIIPIITLKHDMIIKVAENYIYNHENLPKLILYEGDDMRPDHYCKVIYMLLKNHPDIFVL
jgi:hypothetical protein